MPDTALLHAALVGYEQQLATINERIAAIKRQLGGRTASTDGARGGGAGMLRKRRMSPAARKRTTCEVAGLSQRA